MNIINQENRNGRKRQKRALLQLYFNERFKTFFYSLRRGQDIKQLFQVLEFPWLCAIDNSAIGPYDINTPQQGNTHIDINAAS